MVTTSFLQFDAFEPQLDELAQLEKVLPDKLCDVRALYDVYVGAHIEWPRFTAHLDLINKKLLRLEAESAM